MNKEGVNGFLVNTATYSQQKEVFRISGQGFLPSVPFAGNNEHIPEKILDFWGLKVLPFEDFKKQASSNRQAISEDNELLDKDVVISVNGYKEEAGLFAALMKRNLVQLKDSRELIEYLETSDIHSATIVTNLESLNYEFIGNYLRLCERIPLVGFITGTTEFEVRWSLIKALLLYKKSPCKDIFLFASPPSSSSNIFPDVQTLWADDLTADSLMKISFGDNFLTCILSHSNGVDGNFCNFLLCPVSVDKDEEFIVTRDTGATDLEGIPSCVSSSLCQRDPLGKLSRLHPHSINSAVVFYDTCAGLLISGAFSLPEASLGVAFLTGTTGALITSVRKKVSSPYSSVILHAMFYDGYNLGTITDRVNKFQASAFGELPSMILCGDPLFSIKGEREHNKSVIDVPDKNNRLDKWKNQSIKVFGNTYSKEILIPSDDSTDFLSVNFGVSDSSGKSDWWLFRINSSNASTAVKRVSIEDAAKEFCEITSALRRNITFLEIIVDGLRGHTSNSCLEPFMRLLENAKCLSPSFDNIRQSFMSSVWSGRKYAKLLDRTVRAITAVNKLNSAIPAAWQSTKQWFVLNHYYTQCLDKTVPERYIEDNCYICGSKVICRTSENADLAKIVRHMYTCIRCGVLADIPEGFGMPRIEGRNRCKRGEKILQVVTLDVVVSGRSTLFMDACFRGFGSSIVNCEIKKSPINKINDRTCSSTFELHFSKDCPPGLYSFVIIASYILSPVLTAKYITVE